MFSKAVQRYPNKLYNIAARCLGEPVPSPEEQIGLWLYAKGVSAIMVLPFLVNERGDDIFTKMTPGQEFAHPTLLYTGDNRISSKALCVKCGYVCVDVLDFTSGVTGLILFSMYWGFQHRIHQLCGADTLIAATHD
ncbi:uncharacterized protein LOC119441420 [Dermacentor silvarum]|uniref:uncharacterized protein LOC119441420 n=1 Tax=Dermacentor silvarum TaxID=543639 RepID=UPI0018974EB4|nr:uncharacterized protein LOC119441420 [Dermacentor silvarum]